MKKEAKIKTYSRMNQWATCTNKIVI